VRSVVERNKTCCHQAIKIEQKYGQVIEGKHPIFQKKSELKHGGKHKYHQYKNKACIDAFECEKGVIKQN
jgi:hypothetical protein